MVHKNLFYFIFLVGSFTQPFQLKAYQSSPIQRKLIELIDQTVAAHRYWTSLKYTPVKRALTRTPFDWASVSWKNEITVRLDAINALEYALAQQLCQDPDERSEELQNLINHAKEVLNTHGARSHFSRNWLTYTVGAVAAAVGAYKLNTYLDSKTVIILPDSIDMEALREKLINGNVKTEAYRYNNTNQVFINLSDRSQATQILQQQMIPLEDCQFKTASPEIFIGQLYDLQGQDVISKFCTTHITNPLKQLWVNFKEPASQDVITHHENVQDLEIKTRDILQKALTEGYYDEIFTPEECSSKTLNTLRSTKEMFGMIQKVFDKAIYSQEVWIGELEKIGSVATQVASNTTTRLTNAITPRFLTSPRPQTPSVQYSISSWIQAALTNMKLTKNKMEIVADKVEKGTRTNVEIAMMAPAALAAYTLYNGCKAVTHSISTKNTKPFKQDLVSCERILNQQRSQKELSDYHKGMIIYWVTKLASYSSTIPTDYQVRFEADITDLKSTELTIEQKYHTVYAMMRDYAFLS